MPQRLDDVFQAAGQEWNVDPLLLKAISLQESRGDPNAYNKGSQAAGLMQIIPSTARSLGVDDPFDPVQSIWGAAKLMDEALTAEKGSVENALLYYHGGPDWRARFGPESRGYVPGVGKYYYGLLQQQQQAPQPQPQQAPAQVAQATPGP